MKQFKPSELPIGTVIDDYNEGTFRKDARGEWAELQYRDATTQEIVWDEGPTLQNVANFRGSVVRMPADQYFTNFKILAWPAEMVDFIVEEFAKMTGSETVLEEAIERIEK